MNIHFRQKTVQIQAALLYLETYGFLPKFTPEMVLDLPLSAKNCTIPDTGVLPGILQLFAEFLRAPANFRVRFGKKL